MSPRPITTREVRRMCELAEQGLGIMEIARAIGRNHKSVRKYVGDLIPADRGPTVDVERIRDLARRRYSRDRIAAEVGCSPETVSKYAPWTGVNRSLARQAQILAIYEATPPGDRLGIARRFGFSSLKCLHVSVCRTRKRRAAEMKAAA